MYDVRVMDEERDFLFVVEARRESRPEELLDLFQGEKTTFQKKLLRHGAILFRGFQIDKGDVLQSFVETISGGTLNYADGNSPRVKVGGGVYTSTEYPATETITMHNELSYSRQWPAHIFFCCQIASSEGGETPLTDGRRLLTRLDEDLVSAFRRKKVRYIRNLHSGRGFGPSWQDTFETTDREQVEALCEDASTTLEWKADGGARITQVRDALISHPDTGEEVWFNQADQFHPSQLRPEVYEAMSLIFNGREEEFPICSQFGDGSALDKSTVQQIKDVALREATLFSWQPGDLLMVDNVLTLHGRMPFKPPRRILVAMA